MDFDQLHKLCDLKYRNSQQKLAAILERENSLRAELEKLRGYVEETRSLPTEHAQMRAVGADIIWMRWVTTTQSRLNIELAQVLAQKEGHIAQHKRAFGKTQAAQSLAKADKEKLARHRRDQALAQAITQSVLR
ncbi:hypothetical protein [Tateyamaria pelophila]|uniref:hypothetical protein n=1 Tax=Tateyamaria pelophila TaxID=328415 RepID=UPI001CBF27CD|nr:hypothetical protein [Tateyamaria pelophila]